MECRNIFIANPAKLSIQRNQLVIQQEQQFTVPLEDISSILIESQQVTLTAAALSAIANAGIHRQLHHTCLQGVRQTAVPAGLQADSFER